MPWNEAGTEYEGYIPVAALREREPGQIVVMQVQYRGRSLPGAALVHDTRRAYIRRETRPGERFTEWVDWFSHGASVGWLIRQLTTERGVHGRRKRQGSVATYFEDPGVLADRGLVGIEAAVQFRIVVIGEMGKPRGEGDWPESR